MDTVEECLLKADNYASAAMLVGAEDARALMRLSAIWRNRALRMKLGQRGRECLRARAEQENAYRQ